MCIYQPFFIISSPFTFNKKKSFPTFFFQSKLFRPQFLGGSSFFSYSSVQVSQSTSKWKEIFISRPYSQQFCYKCSKKVYNTIRIGRNKKKKKTMTKDKKKKRRKMRMKSEVRRSGGQREQRIIVGKSSIAAAAAAGVYRQWRRGERKEGQVV